MSSGIARRRAAKAQRRKKVLGERRAGAPVKPSSRAGRVMRAASAPIHACLVQDGLFEHGNGTMILARKTGPGTLAVSFFLLDVFCLGIKDAFFREVAAADFEELAGALGAGPPFGETDPSYARKLLHDLAAYALSIGFEPAAEYSACELLFGDIRAEACDAKFQFGYQGKPFYIPGPTETPAQIRRRTKQLAQRLGEDGFDVADPLDEFDEKMFEDSFDDWPDDDVDGDIPGYDPDIAPDPAAWLALDEDERMVLVSAYHKRAGIRIPNATVHAVIHTVVENQIALGDELPVRRAILRLMDEGLDRHEAIHAVGSVLVSYLSELMQGGPGTEKSAQEAYNAEVERLTAESLRASFEEDD